MTTVSILRKSGKIVSVMVLGHAGYAKSGKDIVCAGVSAITQTAILGLIRVIKIEVKYEIDKRFGNLCLEIPSLSEEKRREADVILETMLAGLADIEEGYPRYIKIKEELI